MKRTVHSILALALLASCSENSDQASIRSEIENANRAFMDAVAQKNADAVAALYTEDARLMFSNAPVIEGRENVKVFMQQAMDGGITAVRLSTDEVTGAGDFAVESGRYEMVADGKTVDAGKYLVHWKKVDGKWYLHRDMPSTDAPMATAVAQPGQTVGISVFKVKKGNIEKFERFVKDVLNPAADTSTPAKKQALKSIRMLKGNTPEKDGTHKFIFIFDPYFQEFEYGIENVLVARYGPDRGRELNREFGAMTMPYYEYHDMQQLAAN